MNGCAPRDQEWEQTVGVRCLCCCRRSSTTSLFGQSVVGTPTRDVDTSSSMGADRIDKVVDVIEEDVVFCNGAD